MNPLKEEQAWRKGSKGDLVLWAMQISNFLIQDKESSCGYRQTLHPFNFSYQERELKPFGKKHKAWAALAHSPDSISGSIKLWS